MPIEQSASSNGPGALFGIRTRNCARREPCGTGAAQRERMPFMATAGKFVDCRGVLLVLGLCFAAGVRGQQTPPSVRPDPPSNAAPSGQTSPSQTISSPLQPAAPPAAVSLPVGIFAYTGLPVREIALRGITADAPVVNHLRQLIVQPVNQPLDRQKIAASVRALFATGMFADLQVEAQRTGNEVTLVFAATENLFIGAITVDGAPKRPTPAQLVDASKLELGRLYTTARTEQAIELMKIVLADNGYYQAKITLTEDRHPETQQINLMFHVDPGPVAHIGDVVVEGDPGIEPGQVRHISKLHPGDSVSMPKVTSGLQRLRKYYSKKQRLEAQIGVVDRRYHADTNKVDYVVRISRGATVDIHVAGASISKGKLKKLVPVYEEHAVDDDLLNEGRRNIRDYLQTQGYFDSEVNFVRQPEPSENHIHIVYQVERGVKHDLVAAVLRGNKYFDNALIRERMSVQPSTLLMQHGRFSQELLAADVQNIRDLYLNNGFERVQVTSDVKDDYQGHSGHMAVFIDINEGPQTLVSKLNIDGNSIINDGQLMPLLTIMEGQPYSAANVATDRDSIMNYYFNHGFPDVVFNSKADPDPANAQRMVVTYTIQEGPQVFVDRVLLAGLEYTKRGVVTRQFQIHDKDPLSQLQMLDTQRRLYDLGVFNAVDMAVQNPDGGARYKDLFFQFEEARRWTFNYGLGLEIQSGAFGAQQNTQGTTGVSPRVSFDVTRINFGGRAHTMTFKSNVGRLQQRGVLSYDAPRFMRHQNLRLTISFLYDKSVDVRTFTSERVEGSTQLEQIISKASSLLYRFTYRRVRASNLVVDPSVIPLFSRPVRVGMPSLTYIRDRRDDPIETHNGNFNTLDTGVASGLFGSEAAFGRLLAQNSTYHPFHAKRWVFARSLRLGLAEPFGSTDVLPLPERFFAGGGNSLRGFAINQAGPRDLQTGQPLGGNAMIISNLELRTPTIALPFVGNNVSFVLFHDAGNVFTDNTEMFHNLLRWSQPHPEGCKDSALAAEPANCSFSYISHALGMGIRYRTPIGPVRLDLGYNLNPPVFPVYPNKSNNFAPFHFETLRHLNFYFSIGQTF